MKTKFSDLRKQNGFTIIEIMIVLAVAALIMLIVFLAVPALQRSAHNTQRTADATKIANAVNECLSNRNDVIASCDTDTDIISSGSNQATLDTSTLQQLTTVDISSAPSPVAFPSGNQTAYVYFGLTCTNDGSNHQSGNAQDFVVLYNNQSSSGGSITRCVGS